MNWMVHLYERHDEWSLRLIGSFYSLLGKGLSYKNQLLRGASHSDRAIRVLKGVGDLMAAEQVSTRLAANLGDVELTSASGASAVYLDSAVALLELSGNVQLFGPEVFVLFKNTGCTEDVGALAVPRKTKHPRYLTYMAGTPPKLLRLFDLPTRTTYFC